MNVERLHAIVKALKGEMDGKTLVGQVQNLVNALRSVSQQPNTQNQQNLASCRTNVYQAVSQSEIDPVQPRMATNLDGNWWTGFFWCSTSRKD